MVKEDMNFKLKKIAKSSIIVFLGIFISKLLTYVYKVVIARNFGPEIFGLFSIAIMISGWFITFSSLGLGGGLLRYLSFYIGKKDIKKARYIYQVSSRTIIFSSIFFGAILFFLSDFISITLFHNQELSLFLKIFSFLIPLSILFSIFLGILLSFERIGWYSFIFNILQNFVKVFSLILLIFLGVGIISVPFSYLLGAFFTFFISYLVCKKYIQEIFEKPLLEKKLKKKISTELFSYSWPLLFSGVVYVIFYWADTFIVGVFKTPIDVGFYNVAITIALLLSVTPELFFTIFFPMITKEYSNKKFSTIKDLSKQINKWILIINLPILILILLFPGVFINILFGKEYILAENSLRFLVLGMFFNSIFSISEKLLSMIGKSKVVFLNILFSLSVNIVLSIFLIQKYGIEGVAFSTMLSIFILNILLAYQTKKHLLFIPLKKETLKITLSSILAGSLLVVLDWFLEVKTLALILFGFLFLLSYIFFILILKCLDKSDLLILDAIKRRLMSFNKK
ncbi:MAG: flippase [Nanoarchaeota archaeon]